MNLKIPELSLVVLIGPSGSGKSTFARKHFGRSEVLSSDYCRYLVADDENDQAATEDAFEVLRCIASKRLRSGRLTVIDATNVQPEARQPLLELACQFQAEPIAIVFNLPEHLCLERNANRAERVVLPEVIRSQIEDLQRSLPALTFEGFREIRILSSPKEVATVVLLKDEFQNRQE